MSKSEGEATKMFQEWEWKSAISCKIWTELVASSQELSPQGGDDSKALRDVSEYWFIMKEDGRAFHNVVALFQQV